MGILAAEVAARTAARVTVLERDRLSGAHRRPGVPQASQVHGLLARGALDLEALLPGVSGELVAAGAMRGDMMRDAVICVSGHQLACTESDLPVLSATRPLLEHVVRARVLRRPNIEVVEDAQVTGLVGEGDAIAGVRFRRDGVEGELRADLVVDCSGRASKTPEHLGRLGMPAPEIERRRLDVFYASRFHRVDPAWAGDRKAFVVGPTARHARAGLAQRVEGGLFLVGLTGYGPFAPPDDDDALIDHARQLASSILAELLEHSEPAGPVTRFGLRECVRRRYDEMERHPAGLLVLGDALCSLNPVYAQGMSLAAVQALALRDALAVGADASLAARFHAAVAPTIQNAWRMGAGADMVLPTYRGRRPLVARLIGRWMRRVQRAGATDPRVSRAFGRVFAMVDAPGALLTPAMAWRVLTARARRPERARLAASEAVS